MHHICRTLAAIIENYQTIDTNTNTHNTHNNTSTGSNRQVHIQLPTALKQYCPEHWNGFLPHNNILKKTTNRIVLK